MVEVNCGGLEKKGFHHESVLPMVFAQKKTLREDCVICRRTPADLRAPEE